MALAGGPGAAAPHPISAAEGTHAARIKVAA